ITDDSSGINIVLDQSVDPTSGDKNKEISALQTRIGQDVDSTSTTISDYMSNSAHNGRRLITVVVNNGLADQFGNAYPSSQQAIAVGYAHFLLLPADQYTKNGGSNNPWCAIYVGNSPVPGESTAGAGGAKGQGIGRLRLKH